MELKQWLNIMLKIKGEDKKPKEKQSMWLAYCSESRDEQRIVTPKFIVEKFGDDIAIIFYDDVGNKYIKKVFNKLLKANKSRNE